MSNPLFLLARLERFELPTYGFVVRCSIQLSYKRILYLPRNLQGRTRYSYRMELSSKRMAKTKAILFSTKPVALPPGAVVGKNMSNEKELPFIEHLVELRKRLIIIVVAVTIGMGVAWNFSSELLNFMEKPLTGATYLTDIKKRIHAEVKSRVPNLYARYKLENDIPSHAKRHQLNYSAPLEPFFIQCKISMLTGFILVLPIIFHQIWMFVAPGLTRNERHLVAPFVIVATFTFCVGAMFFLIVIWPLIINFSLSYEAEGIQSWFNISAYVNFCLRLILLFGMIFELPVLTLLLARFGIVSYKQLASKRKYALLASSIIAAFHADLITMFVIMLPLYLMYEISVWVALLFGKKTSSAPAQNTVS